MRIVAARPSDPPARKRSTNVSLSEKLVTEAKTLGLSISAACEQGLGAAVKAERDARWKEENRSAIESWNSYVREHGLPLAKYRMF
jgi:antitoxin CcdA